MARLFVAVWPPQDVVARIEELHRKDQRGVRFVAPENWHITLRFLGEEHPGEAANALGRGTFPPARAHLGPAVDVIAERALVIPAAGLDALATAVTACTKALGAPPRKRFVGHLTLARVKPRAAMPRVLGELFSTEFDVDEISLVQSRLDPRGARYETLAAWPVG